MSRKLGIVKVKSDITKFTEIMARDYELEAFEVTGILAQVLIEWQKRELIESNFLQKKNKIKRYKGG